MIRKFLADFQIYKLCILRRNFVLCYSNLNPLCVKNTYLDGVLFVKKNRCTVLSEIEIIDTVFLYGFASDRILEYLKQLLSSTDLIFETVRRVYKSIDICMNDEFTNCNWIRLKITHLTK